LITLLIFGEVYRLWSSSLYNFLQSPATFSLLGPNILLSLIVYYYISKKYLRLAAILVSVSCQEETENWLSIPTYETCISWCSLHSVYKLFTRTGTFTSREHFTLFQP
jgi:hypothetical protein